MGEKTGIDWLYDRTGKPGATWNATSGCSKVSAGCDHCWAERVAKLRPVTHDPVEGAPFSSIVLHNDRLKLPLGWRRPRNIGVSLMGDLFHKDVPDGFILDVFAVMALAQHHRFVVCTKRPKRARAWFGTLWGLERTAEVVAGIAAIMGGIVWDGRGSDPVNYSTVCGPAPAPEALKKRRAWPGWPLPNVVFMFSAEDQATYDRRVDDALAVPAAFHGVSLEPLLGPVDLGMLGALPSTATGGSYRLVADLLDWVIAGCERPAHRHADDEWFRSLRDQCIRTGTPYFLKQAERSGAGIVKRPPLDGRVWDEMPTVLL
jgi:protein gp37